MAITHIQAMFANNILDILEFSREQNKKLWVTTQNKNTEKLPKVTATSCDFWLFPVMLQLVSASFTWHVKVP